MPDLQEAMARPARIVVAGGSNTGKSMLVNLLVDSPVDRPYSSVSLAKDRAVVYRIRHGPQARVVPDAAQPDVVNIETAAPWLAKLEAWGGLEIIDTPGYGAWTSNQASVDGALDAADEVVLVTDCSRQLTDVTEVTLLRRLADKRPVIVINQIDRVVPSGAGDDPSGTAGAADLRRIVTRVKASVDAALLVRADDGFVRNERTPIFAVSGKRAVEALGVSAERARQEQWKASGVPELLEFLIGRLSHDPSVLNLLKSRSVIGHAERVAASLRGSLERRRLLIDRKLAMIEAARLRTLDFQDAFMSDLHERDLAAIDHSLIRFRKAVDETFDRYSVLQLALQFETLSTQIYDAVFGGRFLHGLEYQMAYVVGRMNEGSRALLERVDRTLTRITVDPQMATHSATQELIPQLNALRDSLYEVRRDSDPLFLTRVVWKSEDTLNPAKLCTDLQTGVTRRVLGLGVLNGASAAATGVAYVAGMTPYTYGTGALLTVTTSIASVYYLRYYWGAQEERLISTIARLHRQMREALVAATTAELQAVTLSPSLTALSQARVLVQARQDWVQARREETDAAVEAVARLKEDVQRALHRIGPPPPPAVGSTAEARPGRQ